MDTVNPIAYDVKCIDRDSERMIVPDSWEAVCHVISKIDGTSDNVSIYRCEIQLFKK